MALQNDLIYEPITEAGSVENIWDIRGWIKLAILKNCLIMNKLCIILKLKKAAIVMSLQNRPFDLYTNFPDNIINSFCLFFLFQVSWTCEYIFLNVDDQFTCSIMQVG